MHRADRDAERDRLLLSLAGGAPLTDIDLQTLKARVERTRLRSEARRIVNSRAQSSDCGGRDRYKNIAFSVAAVTVYLGLFTGVTCSIALGTVEDARANQAIGTLRACVGLSWSSFIFMFPAAMFLVGFAVLDGRVAERITVLEEEEEKKQRAGAGAVSVP